MKGKIKLEDISIRTELQPGDMGYAIYMHGDIYYREYGYGLIFESYVIESFGEFYQNYNPQHDRVWVAEHGDQIAGFLALFRRGADTAQLRFFVLHPQYRGIGLGKKMAALFMDFFKDTGYKHCYLWTSNEQVEAANLYSKLGFKLTEEKDSMAFGKPLREQRYDLFIND